ncbi:MAG: hypothetical protein WDO71_05700 [Bacteroidota bacterium]
MVKAKGNAGNKIEIQHAEVLDKKRKFLYNQSSCCQSNSYLYF